MSSFPLPPLRVLGKHPTFTRDTQPIRLISKNQSTRERTAGAPHAITLAIRSSAQKKIPRALTTFSGRFVTSSAFLDTGPLRHSFVNPQSHRQLQHQSQHQLQRQLHLHSVKTQKCEKAGSFERLLHARTLGKTSLRSSLGM